MKIRIVSCLIEEGGSGTDVARSKLAGLLSNNRWFSDEPISDEINEYDEY